MVMVGNAPPTATLVIGSEIEDWEYLARMLGCADTGESSE
jgi:hypothetical protein